MFREKIMAIKVTSINAEHKKWQGVDLIRMAQSIALKRPRLQYRNMNKQEEQLRLAAKCHPTEIIIRLFGRDSQKQICQLWDGA